MNLSCRVIFLCLLFNQTFGQNITWDDKNAFLSIAEKVEILEDPTGNLKYEDVSNASYLSKFKPSGKVILNFGFTESVHWLKFNFDNTSSEPLLLELGHAFLPETDLYYTDQNGKIIFQEAGYKIPLDDKIVKHHFQIFNLPSGKHDFYVRLISNSHPVPVRIFKASEFEIKAYKQRLVYGFYLGFMAFVILSNLFFFFTLRNKLYLFYAGIVIMYISYASSVMDGFILYFIPNIDMMFWYITIPTIGVTLQIIYALVFLETKKTNAKLYKYTLWLIGYFIVYMIAKFWLPLVVVLGFNTVHALISFFMMGYLGYDSGKKGNRLGMYFCMAYFIYFVLVLVEATYIQIGSPKYFLELSHVALATLIEAIILSFLLSKRFEFEKEETEKARNESQKQLLQQTIENERIVKDQNVMLEKRVEERTKELNNSLENLQNTQSKLIQSEKLASLGELTAGIAHEIQNPLNFVNNFSEVSIELLDEMNDEIKSGNLEGAKEISESIHTNLQKINYHGKRADSIVKGMLQHSRSHTGERVETDINAICEEYIRLAYHGFRAKDKTFNANIKTDLLEDLGNIKVVSQDIARVILNLLTNAFYAVHKKNQDAKADYQPLVKISTRKESNFIKISIQDNGDGVPNLVKDKIFQPFFTTKPTGQGTGLGLSLAYDIIKAHGGEITLDTKIGEGLSGEQTGSEFIISLPID